MISRKKFETEIAGRKLILEVSSIAEQANSSVIARYGETAVLVTVVMGKKDATTNYLPLKVDYEEKFYASGKIIGSRFVRREGKSSDTAVLAGRLIDRTIRPLFDQRMRREVQVVVTVLALEDDRTPDFAGLMAASTALAISDVPWNGPIAGVRASKLDGKFYVNPSEEFYREKDLSLSAFVAGPRGKINMIELSSKECGEEDALEAFTMAQKEIDQLIDFQEKIAKEIGKPKAKVTLFEPAADVRAAIEEFIKNKLENAIYEPLKVERERKMMELNDALHAHIVEKFPGHEPRIVEAVFEEIVDHMVHKNILEKDKRPDGRKLDEVRKLDGEVGLFERTHGSALFVRGNTQSLAVTTIAPPGAEQIVETMEKTTHRRFILHYNFPPYSVGEIGSFRGPGRREIGHGALAEKALMPLIPGKEDFPYTIRVVSEILSSNGSSSMATVCAGSLSLMDAGVPIKKPAAGIAMGLMMDDKGNYKVLTDIQGPEDHYGDMDFKVAGTEEGITAMQMDVKFEGLTPEIIKKTLADAKKARLHILDFMKTVISAPRPQISKYAPSIIQFKISPQKIGALIGPGGKTINGIIARYGLMSIDVDEDGSVFVSGSDMKTVNTAANEVKLLTREIKVGDIVEGPIVKILEFGAIVDLGGGQDGMIHVSELKDTYVKNVTDVVKMGDVVKAKVIRAEDGRIGLSIKQLDSAK